MENKEIFIDEGYVYLNRYLTGFYVIEDKEINYPANRIVRDYKIKNLYTKNIGRVTSVGDFVNKELVRIHGKPINAFIENYVYSRIGHITDKFFVSVGPSNIDSINSTFFASSCRKNILREINNKSTRLKHSIELDKTFGARV